MTDATDIIAKFRAEIAACGSQDSPPIRLMRCLADLCELTEAQKANADQALVNAVRMALLRAEPAVERVRTWQRWSAVVTASVVCLCALVCLWVAVARAPQLAFTPQDTQCIAVKDGEGCWFWAWTKPPTNK